MLSLFLLLDVARGHEEGEIFIDDGGANLAEANPLCREIIALASSAAPQLEAAFIEQEINDHSVMELTDADLKELGVTKMGPRKEILQLIRAFSQELHGLDAVSCEVNVDAVSPSEVTTPKKEKKKKEEKTKNKVQSRRMSTTPNVVAAWMKAENAVVAWGPEADTTLGRAGQNHLSTPGSFSVGGSLTLPRDLEALLDTNLALGKTTARSTMSNEADSAQDASAKAVNGDLDRESDFARTGLEESPWWRVDLGESHAIDVVRIYHRNCCDPPHEKRLWGFEVRVGDVEGDGSDNHNCGNGGNAEPAPGAIVDVPCGGAAGRYVNVRIPVGAGDGDAEGVTYLQLTEVEVYPWDATGLPYRVRQLQALQRQVAALQQHGAGAAAAPGQLAASPMPFWTNLRFSHPTENSRFQMLKEGGKQIHADFGHNGHHVSAAAVNGVFRGAFAIAYQCSYTWGWSGLKLFNAEDYDRESGKHTYSSSEPSGKRFLSTANNNSNKVMVVRFWDGTTSHTPVSEAGKSSGMFWLRRDKDDKVYFGYGDPPSWTLVTTGWSDDLVAWAGLQSPSWVRLLQIYGPESG